jgi:sRNA-binding protein
VAALARVTATTYLESKMAKVFTSRTNGLELHIPADMGAAVRFFSVGEDARRVIDDGSTSTRTDDPDQLKSELARAKARLAVLEAKATENAENADISEREAVAAAAELKNKEAEAEAAKPAIKASKKQVPVPDAETELG